MRRVGALVALTVLAVAACGDGPGAMVRVPGGRAVMGSESGRPDEQPVREVHLSGFLIDRYEVTNADYAAYLAVVRGRPPAYWPGDAGPPGAGRHPVVGVSWDEARAYCAWAGKRLPTEAEWERACRGPNGRTYPWGEEWDGAAANVTLVPLADPDEAWAWLSLAADAPPSLEPVGASVDVSPFGVCDMAGNAAEWVADWYDPDAYERLPATDPVSEEPLWDHAVRGGAWLFRHDDADLMAAASRCAARNASHSADDPRVGFRCAADAP